jgi:hypothetical protein
LVVGAVTDVIGITAVLVGVAAFLLLFALVSRRVGGLQNGEDAPPPASRGGVSSSVDTS